MRAICPEPLNNSFKNSSSLSGDKTFSRIFRLLINELLRKCMILKTKLSRRVTGNNEVTGRSLYNVGCRLLEVRVTMSGSFLQPQPPVWWISKTELLILSGVFSTEYTEHSTAPVTEQVLNKYLLLSGRINC